MRGAFTHFNGYGVLVSRSGMVRMVAGFRSGDVLVGAELVHSEVPVQAAGLAAVQVTGVGIGVSFGVGGAVDGDEAGAHGGCALAGIRVFGHVGNFNAYFTAHLAGCAGNYRRLLNFKGDGRRPHFVVLRTAAERQGGEYGKKARPVAGISGADETDGAAPSGGRGPSARGSRTGDARYISRYLRIWVRTYCRMPPAR